MNSILNMIVKGIREAEGERFANFSALDFKLVEREAPIPIVPLLKKNFMVIAETKKGSPSKGIIRTPYDPVEMALSYEDGGASAISVITEENYFYGKKEHLSEVKKRVNIPVLRKDFIIHPYQVYESYNLGADFILLIVACLSDVELKELYNLSLSLGMEVLVEVHNREELERGLKIKPGLMGINNRDLESFDVDLGNSFKLKEFIREDIFVISESGICLREHINGLKEVGFSGVLIGESLLIQDDPGKALNALISGVMTN